MIFRHNICNFEIANRISVMAKLIKIPEITKFIYDIDATKYTYTPR